MKKIRFTIRKKLIIGFLFVAIIPILTTVIVLYTQTRGLLFEYIMENEHHEIVIQKINMDNFLQGLSTDVLFLSKLASLDLVITDNTIENKEKNLKGLEQDFMSFFSGKDVYYQIRYIDETGQEVVRVDSDGKNIFAISEEKLQNKKGRYYFDDAIEVPFGNVFISPLDLNIERGEIENRGTEDDTKYVPVIRYATPVFDKENNSKGIIITNIYADSFLKILNTTHADHHDSSKHSDTFLINSDGYFLFNTIDKELEWGFMFDNDETVFKYYPDIAKTIFSSESGQFFSDVVDRYITFSRIQQGEQEKDIKNDFWIVFTSAEEDDLFFSINSLYEKLGMFLGVLFIIMISIWLTISRLIRKPINELYKGLNIIKKGKLSYRINVSGKDELADLGDVVNSLAEKLEKNKEDTENKIKKRTSQLEKTNEFMVGRELKMIELKKEIINLKKNKK
jgi:methyl-accepting chemotaxis protein